MKHLILPLAFLFACAPSDAQSLDNVFVGEDAVFFSIRDGRTVPDSVRTDDNWDLRIEGVEIFVNGEGQLVEAAFDAVAEAPETGYVTEGAMPSGSGSGWYDYDFSTHEIIARQDRTLVLRFENGAHAKLSIDSYYHRITDEPRYMSFRFAVTEAGSRAFGE